MINLGIIGMNWITKQFIDAAISTDKYNLSSIYSRNKITAMDFAKKINCKPEVFDNLDDFFKTGVFDTVYIASPNSSHFKQAKLAISNSKNVIVEKPAFANPEQLKKFYKV